MRVFLSWSKPRSKQFAYLIRDWLPEVIQELEPWMSASDIDKGKRWSAEIAARLDEISEGVVCVTSDNVREPWLNFEAGALAKAHAEASVRPLLLDLSPTDVIGPLAEFQATTATDADEMWRFLKSLNDRCERPLPDDRLRRAFDREWPDLLTKLADLKASAVATAPKKAPARKSEEMFAEILDRVRQLERSAAVSPTTSVVDAYVRPPQRAPGAFPPVEPGWLVTHSRYGTGLVEFVGVSPDGVPWVRAAYEQTGAATRLDSPKIIATSPPQATDDA